MINEHKTLYHRDGKGKIRIWKVIQEGDKYKTISGIQDGKLVESEWTVAIPKNVGKVNATTGEEQATAEVKAMYERKLESKYSENLDSAEYRKFLQPMLAHPKFDMKIVNKYDDEFVVLQPKLDGIRSVFEYGQKGMSRKGKPFFTTEHLENEIQKALKKYGVVFDGELYNHEYHDEFEELTSLINTKKVENLTPEAMDKIRDKVELHVYDVIVPAQPEMPFDERFDLLKGIFDEFKFKNIKLVETAYISRSMEPDIEAYIMNSHDMYVEDGYEGLMVRNPKAPYKHARTKDLLKVKAFEEEEMLISYVEEGIGNWAGAVKSVHLTTPKGTPSKSGVRGSRDKMKALWDIRHELPGTEVTVRFQGYTAEDALRFGVVKKFHLGKREN